MEELPAGELVTPTHQQPLLWRSRTVVDPAAVVISQGSETNLTMPSLQVGQPVEQEKVQDR